MRLTQSITFTTRSLHLILCILFFFSGVAALMYQLMWERMLFTFFGVDLESITIIVSVFMFGLGIGGIVGGVVADRWQSRLLMAYILIEFCIAVFGCLSPLLINVVGNALFNGHAFMTAAVNFLLLAFPTVLMGATFPILVTYVNQTNHHIGRSIGSLYFANTLGGAVGAYFSGFILLDSLEIPEIIYHAAFLNIMIAVTAWMVFRR